MRVQLIVGRAHDAVDRRRIHRIEKHHFSEAITGKDLLPKFDGALETGRHGKGYVLSEDSHRRAKISASMQAAADICE